MELANAVISLALVVKQQADDATENVALCQSLSSRAEMIPRLLEKFPDKSNLDEVLLSRIFEQLKSCHDLINLYRKKGAIMRFIKAGTMKNEFQDLESSLGKSIDDLTLAVGVSSAMVLDSIRNNFQQFFQKFNEEHHVPQAKDLQEPKEMEVPHVQSSMIPPSDLIFGTELTIQSLPQLLPLRAREGRYREKQILIREYLISVQSSEISDLLSQVTPLLNFLSHISSQTSKESDLCSVIGWGYTSSPLEQPSAAFPSTLITLFIVTDVFPSLALPLTEFMKSHPSGHPDDEFLLRVGYTLIKSLFHFHSQCSLREKSELLHWPRGIFLHPRNLLIGQPAAGSTICCLLLLFDSFLPLVPSDSTLHSSQRSEFFYYSLRRQLVCPPGADSDVRDLIVWCAPEQMKAGSLAEMTSTVASEIYAFGLILSYLSTGRLPHDPLTPSLQDLREHVRQGRPQNIPHDGSILSEIISYCVAPDPASRPDAISLSRILLSLCQEKRLDVAPLEMPQKVQKLSSLSAGGGDDDDDEDSESGLADFGDLADKVEQLSQSIKLFGSPVVSSVLESPESSSRPVVVVYGQKVVLLNLPANGDAHAKVAASQRQLEEEEEEEEEDCATPPEVSKQQHTGVVIFHIDNTASMKKDNRMALVKAMLLAVVPKYLQLNYLVLVNSWSSNETTKGRIQVCRALNELPPHLLEKENHAAYEKFMEDNLFKPFLEPNGRTDLFGSCFQLFRQMEEELRLHHLPIYSIVLTDGTHNRLDYPLHAPKERGEEYFGVYKATLNNGTKFGINSGVAFDVRKAEEFLKSHFDSLQSLCEALAQEHNDDVPPAASTHRVFTSLVIIGIGEASTQSLSSLATALGEKCSFYGITRTEEILPIFGSITELSGMENRVTLSLPHSASSPSLSFSFRYLTETSDLIAGCHILADQPLVEKLHNAPEILISYKAHSFSLLNSPNLIINPTTSAAQSSSTTSSSAPTSASSFRSQIEERNQQKLIELVKELVSILSKLRDRPYEVTSDTFTTVFQKLQADKKVVTSLKLLHTSKKLRNYRHLAIHTGFGVWIREMDEMIESQIAAYRMNVETEMLTQLGGGGGGDTSPHAEDGSNGQGVGTGAIFQPSEVILERLQNNLRNTGRSVHKVSRHLTSIQTLRDRTIALATTIFSSKLSLQRTSVGLRLDVLHPRSGNSFAIEWSAEQPSAPSSQQEVDLSLVEAIQSALATESFSRSTSSSQQLTSLDRSFAAHSQRLVQMFESAAGDRDGGGLGREEKEEELSFPCLLLRANFDPFTIIKNSSLFTTTALYPSSPSSAAGEEKKSGFYDFSRCSALYCMEDIWDLLCFSSNQYLPGQDFPITPHHSTASSSSSSRPNMAIALGHTPFLFSLYLERSCLYQSCLNVTGDLMAYASTTFQWAKLFYDCFYFLHRSHRMEMGSSEAKGEDSTASMIRSSRRTHVEVGLMALVSYSYACESRQTSPSKSTVLEMFGQQTKATQSSAGAAAAVATAPESPYKIFSRESLPGLTCPLAFSTLLATSSLYSFPQDPPAAAAVWNSLLFTLFSRFCESISGVKVIRNNNSSLAPPLAPPDLRELEESYRLCVGQIQVTLQRRLYVEWPKLDHTEKLHIVSQCATDLSRILKTIVTSFLSGFDRYGLPLWSELVSLMETCLSLQHRGAGVGEGGGIACLREMYSRCDVNLNSVIEDLVSQASRHEEAQAVMATLSLPVVKQQQPGGCCLCLQEMDPASDIEELLAYVEAILATKVSPKIEYKPITRPQHPSLPASVNQALRVTSHLSSWNTANPVVNIGLIGNVNSGKSTLSGRILYDLGLVDKDLVDSRLSEEVKRLGYTSDLRHAWVLDKLQAERSQNVTIVPKFKGFETSLRRYTLIDNPGHKDYLSNVTEGIFQTDIALLLVSGVESERQISGLVNNFLEEFLINAFCYSIKHLVVIINKMDAARYAEEEYLTACESVKKHLKKAGYKINANTVQFIPVSALAGEGIVSTSTQMPWYTGPCLLQLLDEVVIPKRHSEKPLRMVVSEIHKVPGIGVVLCGKVECGSVSVGDTLSCYPDTDTSLPLQSQKGKGKSAVATARKSSSSSAPLRVKSIECHHISLPSASPGDNIGIAVSSTGNISTKSFSKGMILTLSSLPPVPVFVHFEAQLILLKKITIRSGYRPTLLINGNHVPVKITRLLSLIDKNNTVLETSPTSVTQSQICICEMVAQKPFAAETIHDLPKLSKFLIRQNRLTVAIGFIRAPLA